MKNRKLLLLFSGLVIIFLVLFLIFRDVAGIKAETNGRDRELFIPTGSSYENAFILIDSAAGIKKPEIFQWLAKKKKYTEHVRAGRYIIEDGMTYTQIIDMLRTGRQKPVNVTFNNIRNLNQLAGKVSQKIEADSTGIINFLNDESNYSADGFSRETVIAVFIPNTYQFFWNTSPEDFYQRMLKEYRSFWTPEKIAKAKEKNLDPVQVATLASIVDDEVAKATEKPRIAGVYLNRLRIGMPLQSCPTIRFALNDYTITRVLKKHLLVESPYNTYKYRGLPPGPVGCPSIEGIEAVLNAEHHDYLYFAAKADFSGSHNFSRNLSEHNRYAAQYQQELNRRRIFK
ncbi:MAG: endolytic transglycosylase MltG [Chloroflexota bacterium]